MRVRQGDLTCETTEAIVNPADQKLQHVGAMAAYIVKQGGPVIQRESEDKLIYLPNYVVATGNAVATGAGALPFKKIIHAVGPDWGEDGP